MIYVTTEAIVFFVYEEVAFVGFLYFKAQYVEVESLSQYIVNETNTYNCLHTQNLPSHTCTNAIVKYIKSCHNIVMINHQL